MPLYNHKNRLLLLVAGLTAMVLLLTAAAIATHESALFANVERELTAVSSVVQNRGEAVAGDYLRVVTDQEKTIIHATAELIGLPLEISDAGTVRLQGEEYLIAVLSKEAGRQVWLLRNLDSLREAEQAFNVRIFIMAAVAIVFVILTGAMIAVDYQRPVRAMIEMMQLIEAGRIAEIEPRALGRYSESLVFHFGEMVGALKRQQNEIAEKTAEIEELSLTDPLTRAHNRRYLNTMWPSLCAQAQRDGLQLGMVLVDIDHFKSINDLHGHQAGDACLVQTVDLLRKYKRVNDHLVRLGGEEFLLLSASRQTPAHVVEFAERLRTAIESATVEHEGTAIPLTASFGVAVACSDGSPCSFEAMYAAADENLYKAKASGRNRVVA